MSTEEIILRKKTFKALDEDSQNTLLDIIEKFITFTKETAMYELWCMTLSEGIFFNLKQLGFDDSKKQLIRNELAHHYRKTNPDSAFGLLTDLKGLEGASEEIASLQAALNHDEFTTFVVLEHFIEYIKSGNKNFSRLFSLLSHSQENCKAGGLQMLGFYGNEVDFLFPAVKQISQICLFFEANQHIFAEPTETSHAAPPIVESIPEETSNATTPTSESILKETSPVEEPSPENNVGSEESNKINPEKVNLIFAFYAAADACSKAKLDPYSLLKSKAVFESLFS